MQDCSISSTLALEILQSCTKLSACPLVLVDAPKVPMIFGRPTMQCPHASCVGRCNATADETQPCSCDAQCLAFGDCCVDVLVVCFGATPLDTSILFLQSALSDAMSKEDIRRKSECRDLVVEDANFGGHYRRAQHKRISIVTQWHSGFRGDERMNLSIEQRIPVCHVKSQLVFDNIFTAMGYGLSSQDLLPFQVRVRYCRFWFKIVGSESYTSNRNVINEMCKRCPCSHSYKVPNSCVAIIKRNWCGYNTPEQMNDDVCFSYHNPVFVKSEHGIYRNQFCLSRPIMISNENFTLQNIIESLGLQLRCYQHVANMIGFVHYQTHFTISLDMCDNYTITAHIISERSTTCNNGLSDTFRINTSTNTDIYQSTYLTANVNSGSTETYARNKLTTNICMITILAASALVVRGRLWRTSDATFAAYFSRKCMSVKTPFM